jgi:hypothetical protein
MSVKSDELQHYRKKEGKNTFFSSHCTFKSKENGGNLHVRYGLVDATQDLRSHRSIRKI